MGRRSVELGLAELRVVGVRIVPFTGWLQISADPAVDVCCASGNLFQALLLARVLEGRRDRRESLNLLVAGRFARLDLR